MIDSHCHLYFENFDSDLAEVISRAKEVNIEKIINIGIDIDTSLAAIQLAIKYKHMKATVGIHPHSAHEIDLPDAIEELRRIYHEHKQSVCAVGEIGLDYYKSKSDHEIQKSVFRELSLLAGELNLPIVIHSRDAFLDTIQIVKEVKNVHPNLKALFHCYTYGIEEMRELIEVGAFISLSGIVSFPNAGELKEVARDVPIDRLLIETDAPYLSPQPMRGKRNEPAFLRHTAQAIADLRNATLEDIDSKTHSNTLSFFDINCDGPAK